MGLVLQLDSPMSFLAIHLKKKKQKNRSMINHGIL